MKTTTPDPDREAGLRRPRDDRMLFGVAAGVADHFDLDRTVVRLGFVVLALTGGIGVPLYVATMLLIPEQGADRSLATELLGHFRLA